MTNVVAVKLSILALLVVVTAKRSFAAPCNQGSLGGKYGFAASGQIPEKLKDGSIRFDPVSQVAIVEYDGQGHVSLSAEVQYHGGATPLTLKGSYEVKDTCTGVATFKNQDGTTIFGWHFVIVDEGRQVETIALRPTTANRPMYSLTFTQKKL